MGIPPRSLRDSPPAANAFLSGCGVSTVHDNEQRHPQWDLTLEIASGLWYDGEYTFVVSPEKQQKLVDVHWAALQAGRLLGVRSKVRFRGPSTFDDPTISVTVTFTDPGGLGRKRARDGFEKLLQAVREEYHR